MLTSEIVPIFTKALKNRSNFAVLIVADLIDVVDLIDEPTRAQSNVHGWKKEALDPSIIE